MNTKTCAEPGCDGERKARGLCGKHYQRLCAKAQAVPDDEVDAHAPAVVETPSPSPVEIPRLPTNGQIDDTALRRKIVNVIVPQMVNLVEAKMNLETCRKEYEKRKQEYDNLLREIVTEIFNDAKAGRSLDEILKEFFAEVKAEAKKGETEEERNRPRNDAKSKEVSKPCPTNEPTP